MNYKFFAILSCSLHALLGFILFYSVDTSNTIKPIEIKKARELEKYSFEEDFFIDAIRNKNNRKLPIAALGKPNFRNQHLSYAITWYSLALTLLIIYFIFHIKEKRLTFKKRR